MIKSGHLSNVIRNKFRSDSKVRTWSKSKYPSKKGHMAGIIDQNDVFFIIKIDEIHEELQILTKYGVGFININHLELDTTYNIT